MAFPCSGILYIGFKSLGLDITSVLLNPFKMVATYPFLGFLSIKESYRWFIRARYTVNRKVLAVPTNFLEFEICLKFARIGSFRFL